MRLIAAASAGFTMLLPLLFACAMDAPERGTTNGAIINGTVDTDPAHDAVVALTDADGIPFCTGTYVGNGTIVTAAHCLDAEAPEFAYFGVDELADNEDCLDGFDDACYQFLYVDDYLVHGDYSSGQPEAGSDIALLYIGDDPGVEPIPFLAFTENTELTESDVGTRIAFVGFGVTDGIAQSGSGIRRTTDGVLEALGPDSFDLGGDVIALGQDQVLALQPESGTCQGDSGGPMLIERDGIEMLAAVTSFGDDGCLQYGVSVTVDVHEPFIREFYGDGDIPGRYDPDTGGDDGDGDDGGVGGCTISEAPPTLLLTLLALFLLLTQGRSRTRVS